MLPNSENIDDLVLDFEEDERHATQTFRLNTTENIVGGKVDELEALKQSIYLMLNTEADQYIIYPYTYGMNTVDLIGKPHDYVIAVLPERIKKALLRDDRITNVSDFEFERSRRAINVKFIVHTIYGKNIENETVVTY